MAAPRKRAAPPPEPRVPHWLAHPVAIAATVLVLTSGATYSCTTIRNWLNRYDLWNRASELVITKHEPQLEKLTELVTQQATIVEKQEARITTSEETLATLRQLKEREQERLDAQRDYQRQACLEGKLDRDFCKSQGFSTPE